MSRKPIKIFQANTGHSDEDGAHIGRRLREVRELAGFSQSELARKLGVHQSALSRMEKQHDILVSSLRDYVEALGAELKISASFDRPGARVSSLEEMDYVYDTSDDQFVLPIVGEDHYVSRRDIVFSIKPQYSQKILEGKKTIELRRRFPTDVPAGTVALIYSTTPDRALTGVAEIAGVERATVDEIWTKYSEAACIGEDDFRKYFEGLDSACAIRLRHPRTLPRALSLGELRDRFGFEPPQSFLYAKTDLRKAIIGHDPTEVSNRH